MSFNENADVVQTFSKPIYWLADAQCELQQAIGSFNSLDQEITVQIFLLKNKAQKSLDLLWSQKNQALLQLRAAEKDVEKFRTAPIRGEILDDRAEAEQAAAWHVAKKICMQRTSVVNSTEAAYQHKITKLYRKIAEVNDRYHDEINDYLQRALAAASIVNAAENENENESESESEAFLQSFSNSEDELADAQYELEEATDNLNFLLKAKADYIYKEKVSAQKILDRLEWQKNQARLELSAAEELAEDFSRAHIRGEMLDSLTEAKQLAAWNAVNEICMQRALVFESAEEAYWQAVTEHDSCIAAANAFFENLINDCWQREQAATNRVNAAKNDGESDAFLMDDWATVPTSAGYAHGTLQDIAQPADDQWALDMMDCDDYIPGNVLSSIPEGDELAEQQENDPAGATMLDCELTGIGQGAYIT